MKFKFNLFKSKEGEPSHNDSWVKFDVWIHKNSLPKEIDHDFDFSEEILKNAIKAVTHDINYQIRAVIAEDERFKEIIYQTFLNNSDLKKVMEDVLAEQVKHQFRQMLGMRDRL